MQSNTLRGENTPIATAKSIDPFIFFSTLLVVVALLGWTLVDIDSLNQSLIRLRSSIVSGFTWLFVVTVTGLVTFALYLAASRYGHIKLGDQHSQPLFSTGTWFAMLFSTGMGIGLVFYGVAEPILHFSSPPHAQSGTAAAARDAMRFSIFHWGIHAWGIYAVMGLALAFSHFRYHQPLAVRSTLAPLLGQYTHRWPGKLIDVLAVLATLFGLATSLGLGATQINAGFQRLFGVQIGIQAQLLIIACITLCATVSLVTGLERGIRRLSELNMLLAVLLLLFVFFGRPYCLPDARPSRPLW